MEIPPLSVLTARRSTALTTTSLQSKKAFNALLFRGCDKVLLLTVFHFKSLFILRSYLGPSIFSGRTHWSNCSAVRMPRLMASSLSVVPFL